MSSQVVHVEPAGLDIAVDPGEPIMLAAERQGIHWPTVCHGHAECTACFVEVVKGAENLVAAAPVETQALATMPMRRLYRDDQILRLACQTRVVGDVTVVKRGVRPVAD